MSDKIISHEYKGWKYIQDTTKKDPKNAVSIIPHDERPVPDSLYKFYSLSSYNLDALKKNYLYASHPHEINDKFDCFKDLIDYDSAPDDLIKFYLQIYHSKEEINEKFTELKKGFRDFFPISLFSGFGVISFTTKVLNPLMWAHHSSANHGFAIKFKHELFHEKILGPFPLNYQTEWEPIALKSPMLAFLYLTNIKSNVWNYEDEWRFIGTGTNMSTPRFKEEKKFKDNRKFPYDKNAIEEIILGNMFVDRINKYSENGNLVLAFTPDVHYGKEKFDLLHFIVDNKIKTSRIVLKQGSYTFELDTSPVEIQKIDNYSFMMKI